MNIIKFFFGIVIALLVAGIGAGVYVWYTVQELEKTVGDARISVDDEVVSEAGTLAEEESIVVETTDLTPAQQDTLTSFGFEGERITITPAMLTCAKQAVSEPRFDEILGGSAPTPLEAMKLLPCLKP